MIPITPSLYLNKKELKFVFIRASGPGGQNVNKVATAVQLRFDVGSSPSLLPEQKQRLTRLAGHLMNEEGILVIEARRHRNQEQNKRDATERLVRLLEKAVAEPKKRIPTRVSQATREKRMQEKRQRAENKRERKKNYPD